MVKQLYLTFCVTLLSFLLICSLQFGSLSGGNRILTRGEGFTGSNYNRYTSKYGSQGNSHQWGWYRSWGDTSKDFSERRKHRFCFRHPGAPGCNWPHPPPPDCAACLGRSSQIDRRPFPPPFPPPPVPEHPPPPPSFTSEPQEPSPNEQPDEQPQADPYEIGNPFGYLPEAAKKSMLESCSSGRVNCRSSLSEMTAKRDMIVQQEKTTLRLYSPTTSYGSNSNVDRQLEMTDSLKKTLLKVAGLGNEVDPVTDGTFEQDVLLTEEQSTNLMNELKNNMYSTRRYKRSSLFLEQMPNKRWDTSEPIIVYFDDNVADYERQMVHQAHQMIQTTTCIRFQTSTDKPVGSHIYYAKIPSPSFCGLSYIGKVTPLNPVYLSFLCQDPVGVALHETMHTLGMNHEHLRNDRDDYIDMQWSNINPQFYDYFAIADSSKFTPYGINYDYGSIMHYNAFTAAIDSSQPTMLAKQNRAVNQPLMGQRKRLGERDVQMLNTMYCRPNCEDKNVYCGVWALRNLCTTQAQIGWMGLNCRKSCRLC